MYTSIKHKIPAFFFLLCFSFSGIAMAEDFKGASSINGGAGGAKERYGDGASFITEDVHIYAHNYEELRKERIYPFQYINYMHTGRSGRYYRGGAGGDISFGNRDTDYAFAGGLSLAGGHGGESDNTGVGANGGSVRMAARSITVSGDLNIISGNGGPGAKGGNVYAEFARRLTADNINIYGGRPGSNFGNSGNINLKGFIARVTKEFRAVRSHNNMHIGLDMLELAGDDTNAYIESSGPLGALRMEIGSLEVYGAATIGFVGTRVGSEINTGIKIIENEVHVKNIHLHPDARLRIERHNGDFVCDSLIADEGSEINGYLPLQGRQLQFRVSDPMIKKGDSILTLSEPTDITGAKISIMVKEKLKKLKRGQSIVLMTNVTGDMEPFELVADLHAPGKHIFEVLIRGKNLEARLL